MRRMIAVFAAGLLLTLLTGGSCDGPDVVPPPPFDRPPETVELPAWAPVPSADYDHRLKWHYARLIDPEIVQSYAGEKDLAREMLLREAADPQRQATVDLLAVLWNHTPRPEAHVRVALIRLLAQLAPNDPRTTLALLAALEDPTMKVRFRANNQLKDLYATNVDFDPNEPESAVRTAAVARWKKVIQTALQAQAAAAAVPPQE